MNVSATMSSGSGSRPHWLSRTSRSFFGVISLVALSSAVASESTEEVTIDFNRSIRPILSDHCFQCHGPDAASREANLRLDQREDATRDRRDGPAISPGDADASEAILRIRSSDPNLQMPPPEVPKRLTRREIELLETWIESGAAYDPHWAFQRVTSPRVPSIETNASQSGWPRNPIDSFVLSQLSASGFSPSPEADSATLARRLSIDIVGLAPDPERVAEFEVDHRRSPDTAVRNYARELLSSPHYGERWGRHWLDQARYADSHGYTIDGERAMWPYRDWVISAINHDMPFD